MMTLKASALSLSFAFFIGTAVAQTPSGPIVNGRHLQPTQQQVDSREGYAGRQWNARVQSDIDRLYDEITGAATTHHR